MFCRGKKKYAEMSRWNAGFTIGKKKDVMLSRGRMNLFCRGKKKDFEMSRCKNVFIVEGRRKMLG